MATQHNRLPFGVDSANIEQLFHNLKLLTDSGELTRAAVLLFGKSPTRFFRCATFKIGRFRGVDPTDLIVHDLIEGNLFTMFEQVINFLKSKYLLSPISYQGMQRVETLEIPDRAIREAVLNALIHKDYTGRTAITLRVYDPTVSIWNEGELEKLTIEDLSREHGSYQRNPLIADVFFRAGSIEAWGRGTLTFVDERAKGGLSAPVFEAYQGGVRVTFLREPVEFVDGEFGEEVDEGVDEESNDESDSKLDSKRSLRQQKAVDYVRENGSISNKIYQEINDISRRTATNDLTELVQNLIFEKTGSAGESVKYVLVAH
jgi:ATP-dependent DNA helicase RecG